MRCSVKKVPEQYLTPLEKVNFANEKKKRRVHLVTSSGDKMGTEAHVAHLKLWREEYVL